METISLYNSFQNFITLGLWRFSILHVPYPCANSFNKIRKLEKKTIKYCYGVLVNGLFIGQFIDYHGHVFYFYAVSSFSLFPLLFEAQEYPIKVLLLLLHSIIMWLAFSAHFTKNGLINATASAKKGSDKLEVKGSSRAATKNEEFLIGWIGKIYLLGLLVVEIWGQFLHPYLLGDRLPFVPLMLISVYCAFGFMYSWIWQLKRIIRSSWFMMSWTLFQWLVIVCPVALFFFSIKCFYNFMFFTLWPLLKILHIMGPCWCHHGCLLLSHEFQWITGATYLGSSGKK